MNPRDKARIWIVEDDAGAQFVYREILGPLYELELFPELVSFAKRLSGAELPDLIIADLSLADESFLDFLGAKESSRLMQAPFMIVSSLDDAETLRTCYEEGALDYLIKPFTKNELIVKVERIIQSAQSARTASQRDESASAADSENGLTLDPTTLTVRHGHRAIVLTAKELRIFSLLYAGSGSQISRRKIEKEVWGKQNVTEKTLDVHLFNLRKKLSKLSAEIIFIEPESYALLPKKK